MDMTWFVDPRDRRRVLDEANNLVGTFATEKQSQEVVELRKAHIDREGMGCTCVDDDAQPGPSQWCDVHGRPSAAWEMAVRVGRRQIKVEMTAVFRERYVSMAEWIESYLAADDPYETYTVPNGYQRPYAIPGNFKPFLQSKV